jgi:hypothetical protein
MDYRFASSGRAPALQTQSPDFKPSCTKKKKRKKERKKLGTERQKWHVLTSKWKLKKSHL